MRKTLTSDIHHPFYSDEAVQKWKKRSRELEQEEKDIGKRRKHEKDDHGSPKGIEQNVQTSGTNGEISTVHG
jgi:hypothetical protein